MKRPLDLLPDFVREGAEISRLSADLSLIETLGLLALLLAPIAPSTRARTRLLSAVSGSPSRFAPFFGRLASFFDLGVERIEEIMARITDPTSWEPGPLPGLMLMHFEGGPRCAAADVGLVRLEPGFCLPPHRHLSTETAMILEGGYREDTGRVYLPGDVHQNDEGYRPRLSSIRRSSVPARAGSVRACRVFGVKAAFTRTRARASRRAPAAPPSHASSMGMVDRFSTANRADSRNCPRLRASASIGSPNSLIEQAVDPGAPPGRSETEVFARGWRGMHRNSCDRQYLEAI